MSFMEDLLRIPDQNCLTATLKLLKALRVPVTKTTLREKLLAHPDYPSLLSVSDVLTGFNIANGSVRVSKEDLQELPLPFIAQVESGEKEYFIVVTAVKDSLITCTDEKSGQLKQIPVAVFEQRWSGVVLLTQPASNAGEPAATYKKNRQEELRIAAASIILLIGIAGLWLLTAAEGVAVVGQAAWALPALLTLKLAGLITCLFLLLHEVDAHNPLLEKVCKPRSQVNCAAVLSAEGASIGGIISWSEVGFAYFAGGLLVGIMSGMDSGVMSLLAWLNVLALPYILYSLFYQWRIVKQWCLLCLAVQTVLLAEGAISFTSGLYAAAGSVPAMIFVKWLLVGLLPVTGWLLVKPYLLLAKNHNHTLFELNRFKYNADLFTAALHKQRMLVDDPGGLGITLGPANASRKLIKVCNPYCGPCAQAHTELEGMLDTFDDVQVQVIFTAENDPNDIRLAPVAHFLAIASKGDETLVRQVMHDWYTAPQKDYNAFARRYPLNGELQQQGDKVEQMRTWVQATGIRGTPTFFFNGYELPDAFNISDLKILFAITEPG